MPSTIGGYTRFRGGATPEARRRRWLLVAGIVGAHVAAIGLWWVMPAASAPASGARKVREIVTYWDIMPLAPAPAQPVDTAGVAAPQAQPARR